MTKIKTETMCAEKKVSERFGGEQCAEKNVSERLVGIKVWFEAIEGENDEGG